MVVMYSIYGFFTLQGSQEDQGLVKPYEWDYSVSLDSDTEIKYVRSTKSRTRVIIPQQIGQSGALGQAFAQIFSHEHHEYEGIDLSVFNEKYSDRMLAFYEQAQHKGLLSFLACQQINSARQAYRDDFAALQISDPETAARINPELRTIGKYELVGEIDEEEGYCNISRARKYVINAIKRFIHDHMQEVRRVCVRPCSTSTQVSQAVWAAGCCDLQGHVSCLKECQKFRLASCPNLFCAQPWNTEFYDQLRRKNPIVSCKKMHEQADCPICLEPLYQAPHQCNSSSSSSACKDQPAKKKYRK